MLRERLRPLVMSRHCFCSPKLLLGAPTGAMPNWKKVNNCIKKTRQSKPAASCAEHIKSTGCISVTGPLINSNTHPPTKVWLRHRSKPPPPPPPHPSQAIPSSPERPKGTGSSELSRSFFCTLKSVTHYINAVFPSSDSCHSTGQGSRPLVPVHIFLKDGRMRVSRPTGAKKSSPARQAIPFRSGTLSCRLPPPPPKRRQTQKWVSTRSSLRSHPCPRSGTRLCYPSGSFSSSCSTKGNPEIRQTCRTKRFAHKNEYTGGGH